MPPALALSVKYEHLLIRL